MPTTPGPTPAPGTAARPGDVLLAVLLGLQALALAGVAAVSGGRALLDGTSRPGLVVGLVVAALLVAAGLGAAARATLSPSRGRRARGAVVTAQLLLAAIGATLLQAGAPAPGAVLVGVAAMVVVCVVLATRADDR